MTVKCLSAEQQRAVVYLYQTGMTQKRLSEEFLVSERTIHRVLIDAGLFTPTERIQAEAAGVMRLLRKYNVRPEHLERILKREAMAEVV